METAETPPQLLYHYTTQPGLLGIIEHKEIWATHFRHLNDRQEFAYATGLLRQSLEESAGSRWSEEEIAGALKAIEIEDGDMKRIEIEYSLNLFVASFSEVPDSLPQWRAYAHSEPGYSLGFDASEAGIESPPNFQLVRCIYDESEQRTRVEDATRQILNDDLFTPTAAAQLLLRYLPFALRLKHPSFKDEMEWRIASEDIPDDAGAFSLPLKVDPPLHFRQGKSGIIPYRKIPLKDRSGKFPLKEIVIGPCPDPERSRSAVKSLLATFGLGGVAVQLSKVPYRNW